MWGPASLLAISSTHEAASQPLEKSQWPVSRNPPGTDVALLREGLNEVEDRVFGSETQYSSCAFSGNKPTSQLWLAQIP